MADEGAIELGQQIGGLLGEIAGELEHLRHPAAVMRHDAGGRIDREGEDFFRRVVGDLLDVHAAFGGDDKGDARGLAVDQRRKIELALDGRAFLDIDAVDLLAVRAGLVRHQRRAEDAGRFLFHVVDGFDHLDAAGLAAPAGMDLRLHHPDRAAELGGAFQRLVNGKCRHAARHRNAEFAQHGFGLILVDVHENFPGVVAGADFKRRGWARFLCRLRPGSAPILPIVQTCPVRSR